MTDQPADHAPTAPTAKQPPATKFSAAVVVLTHNRSGLLHRGLESIFAQSIECEVVVVDNGSEDGTAEMVRSEFPAAKLVALSKNTGIRGRNLGVQAAHSDVVLSLDDDIELTSTDTLGRILRAFEDHPDLGALSLKVCDGEDLQHSAPEHWWHPVPASTFEDQEFETDRITEAAVAFRREKFLAVGGYLEALFWGAEEWDLALGLIDAGCQLRYLPEPVRHLAPRGSLDVQGSTRHALNIRNRIWIAFRRLPLVGAAAFALPRLLLWGARSIRYGYFLQFAKGCGSLLVAAPKIWASRKVISAEARAKLRRLRRKNPARRS